MLVYGIDSPYLRYPSRLTAKVGSPGAAKLLVEALIQAQPERPRRTAIILANKGRTDRCSRDGKLMQLLADRDTPNEPFARFIEDAKMGGDRVGSPSQV